MRYCTKDGCQRRADKTGLCKEHRAAPETILAWHLVGATLRDGQPIPADGVTLKHKGPLELCATGYHASERLIDALKYAPGDTICRVKCGGTIMREDDKLVCRERTIIWRIDAADLLRRFARQCALDVSHLRDMPPTVRQYLEMDDETLRDAVWDAVRAARAAWAARAAASIAASGAVWAERDPASDTVSSTAILAVRAAMDADRAVDDAQNSRLEAMIMEAHEART